MVAAAGTGREVRERSRGFMSVKQDLTADAQAPDRSEWH